MRTATQMMGLVFGRYFLSGHSSGRLLQYNLQRRKIVHNHHRKKILWRTFLAGKNNFPGRWWIQKPYKNQENHIHHRNLSSVDPIFSAKFCTGAGRCMLSFSQTWRSTHYTQKDYRINSCKAISVWQFLHRNYLI